MVKNNKINRREFLGQASCAAVGSTTFLSTLLNLQTMNASAGFNSSIGNKAEDYKAIICLLNSGGLDSYNMLVPRTGSAYQTYATTRSNMAIPAQDLLPINPLNPDGNEYGVSPHLPNVRNLFENGKLSFLTNIGSLVQPINKQQFLNGTVPTPLGLQSHADQLMHWQTGTPHQRSAIGWGGRIADMLNDVNENQQISMSISTSGSNIFQTGINTSQFNCVTYHSGADRWRNGAVNIHHYNDTWYTAIKRREAIDAFMNPTYANIFKNTFRKTIKSSINGAQLLDPITSNPPIWNEEFEDTQLSNKFELVARIIAGHEDLNVKRQIFFIDYGGWDHHLDLLTMQESMFQELDNALFSFQSALEQLNVQNQVLTIELSEFARTTNSNGNGTDHGWGGNVFSMGGPVRGKRIFGNFPSLAMTNWNLNNDTNPLDLGGTLIPTLSADEYFAEIALWYGVPSSELVNLFPNLGYFYDPMSGNNPIGFLNL